MLVDVRSPAEYAHAHIPGAVNIAILNNEERHLVGLCYKQKGKDQAVELALELVGPKFASYVKKARSFESVEVYCWRGGMRSTSMAWLFNLAGIPTTVREGGYKLYRQEVLTILSRPYKLRILTGFTGCGKTEVLRTKEQYIDLEALANHRGSAFGALGLGPQPSNEQLENCIAAQLLQLDPNKEIWVEDESRVIGSCKIPDAFFETMRCSERETLNCSFEARMDRLISTYGNYPTPDLEKSILQLTKRLGGKRTQEAIKLLYENKLRECFTLLLEYYDKAYEKSQNRYNRYNGTLSKS
ncbi:MAG: tRNA 2-selenouridine(34) synthase MnmH [Chlamydiales bacterium]|nr:tRNA 2-selenouridine(34) synthase MnmH [Chlamydiales bacterium]